MTKSVLSKFRQKCTCTQRRVKYRVHRESVGDNTVHESRTSMAKVTNLVNVKGFTPNSIGFYSAIYVTTVCDMVTVVFIFSEKTPGQTYKPTRTISL